MDINELFIKLREEKIDILKLKEVLIDFLSLSNKVNNLEDFYNLETIENFLIILKNESRSRNFKKASEQEPAAKNVCVLV